MARSVTVKGIEELQKIVVALRLNVRKEANQALRDALKPMMAEAARLAPQGPTGNLRKSLIAMAPKSGKGNKPYALGLGVWRWAPHLHLVAFGRKRVFPGMAKGQPTGKKALFGHGFGPRKTAAPTKPNTFFVDAVASKRSETATLATQYIKGLITKIVTENGGSVK